MNSSILIPTEVDIFEGRAAGMEVIYLSLRDGHVDRAAAFDRQSWEEFVDAVVTADERINEGTESLESIDVE